ncbi:hypothetical protein Sgly_2753 [Syntrophobotulus glycolicus DSM 8271]|uniref:WD40-like beta Propeller containing protein n=1 Tax=Syntrophobotulus glycolicus (strain DSM 8271 / FlGlyR) TaxID=645991 RepID=F0SXW4_SYNGF|nr:hypothetical protein [Syntrophobotulus glycolicus]ADY57025.1 hypothetical protein Sgly_2753 [Syntrophobotulus glycolicus DSM 8271]
MKTIGYQNWKKAFFYDRASLSLTDNYTKKSEVDFIRYSSDMEYLAEVRKDDLYISNNQLKESKKIDTSSQYSSLSWSKDNAKLVYISNSGSNINIIDRDSLQKQTLTGGKDFQCPDGWVELMWCYFLPNNTDIFVHILGENNDSIAIIDSTGAKKPKLFPENGSITTWGGISDHLIVYAVNENESKEEKLICYDYLADQRHVIHNSTELIVSAGFSPDENSVFLATLLKGGESEQLYTFNLN